MSIKFVLFQIFLYYVIFIISVTKSVTEIEQAQFDSNFNFLFGGGLNITENNPKSEEKTEAPKINECDDVLLPRSDCKYEEYQNKATPNGVTESQDRTKLNNMYDKCGVRNKLGLLARLNNGIEAKTFEFPWIVLIYFNSSITSEAMYAAAGSLIHPKIVITVAKRILHPAYALVVRAGESNLITSTNTSYPYQNRNVLKIITHDHFNSRTLYNNIALLILEQQFDLSPNIRTICLPPPLINFDKSLCTIAAWDLGEIQYDGGIMKSDVSIEPKIPCQNAIRRASGRNGFNLDDTFLCAGGSSGNDASIGDGGSPLFCPIENSSEYYLVGMVSAGVLNPKVNVPGVYTNIPYLRSWIDEKVLNEKLTIDYYTHL